MFTVFFMFFPQNVPFRECIHGHADFASVIISKREDANPKSIQATTNTSIENWISRSCLLTGTEEADGIDQ